MGSVLYCVIMLDGDYSQHGDLGCTKVPLRELQENCYSSDVSHDGKFIAFTMGNGSLKIFDTKTMKQVQRTPMGIPFDGLPSTGVAWAPSLVNGQYRIANTNSQGGIFTWSWGGPGSAADALERQLRIPEEKNDTSVCEFSLDGKHLFTAGSDRSIRMYDLEAAKGAELVNILNKGVDDDGNSRPAHSNRIFSLKFVSPTTFISAGWQSPIQVWDMRTSKAVRQITGAFPASDCLEPIPGSTRFFCCSAQKPSNQIQVFDYVQCREIVEESDKFSLACDKSPVTAISYRPEIESLWAASSKPDQIVQLCVKTGVAKNTVPCGVQLMTLATSAAEPTKVYASGMKETCYVIEQQ
eukprot:GILI01010021.1.p1 GENE.GILI01010021.1~~GILI01010021.1.p1  ORF type:complete len:353 (+),score=26.52 GILI01010021.1:2-1060(+)